MPKREEKSANIRKWMKVRSRPFGRCEVARPERLAVKNEAVNIRPSGPRSGEPVTDRPGTDEVSVQ